MKLLAASQWFGFQVRSLLPYKRQATILKLAGHRKFGLPLVIFPGTIWDKFPSLVFKCSNYWKEILWKTSSANLPSIALINMQLLIPILLVSFDFKSIKVSRLSSISFWLLSNDTRDIENNSIQDHTRTQLQFCVCLHKHCTVLRLIWIWHFIKCMHHEKRLQSENLKPECWRGRRNHNPKTNTKTRRKVHSVGCAIGWK